MKKFFAFVVAMAMTVAANAGLVTFAENGTTINAKAGDIVQLSIIAPGATMLVDGLVTLDGDGTIAGYAKGSAWDAAMSMDIPGDKSLAFGYAQFNGMSGNVLTLNVLFAGPKVIVNLVGATDIQGGSFSTTGEALDVAGQVTIVPEPMTMALLGLGGLVAARRRNA